MSEIQTIFLENMLEKSMKKALELGAEDFAGKAYRETETLIRFSNNNISIISCTDTSKVDVYIGYKKRRLFATSESVSEENLFRIIERMIRNAENLEPYEYYTNLPRGKTAVSYTHLTLPTN